MNLPTVCVQQWNGNEVGRTDVQQRTAYPRWIDGARNVFILPLEQKSKEQSFWQWQRYYPELRIDVYDMMLNDEHQPSKGQL